MANTFPTKVRAMVLEESRRSRSVWRSSFDIGAGIGIEGHRVASACTILRAEGKLESRKIGGFTQWRPVEFRKPVSIQDARDRKALEALHREQAGKSMHERRAW